MYVYKSAWGELVSTDITSERQSETCNLNVRALVTFVCFLCSNRGQSDSPTSSPPLSLSDSLFTLSLKRSSKNENYAPLITITDVSRTRVAEGEGGRWGWWGDKMPTVMQDSLAAASAKELSGIGERRAIKNHATLNCVLHS